MSWREELTRREEIASDQVEELRGRIAELTEQLQGLERRLSRLVITRETMTDLLAEVDDLEVAVEHTAPQPVSVGSSPIGLVLVPQREPGMDPEAVLPQDYGDILAVLSTTAGGLRAGQVAAELGINTIERSKVEALRSKLKRLVARGWAEQQPSGVFMIANDVGVTGD